MLASLSDHPSSLSENSSLPCPDPQGLTPPQTLEMLFGLFRKRTVSLSARSCRLSGRCMVAAFLWVSWEVGARVFVGCCFLGTAVCVLQAHPRAQLLQDNTNGNV